VLWPLLVLLLCSCGRIDFDLTRTDATPQAGDAPQVDAPRLMLDAGQCPAGYQHVATSCYRVAGGVAGWVTGEQLCEADAQGAHLVVVDDATERNTIMTSIGITAITWIGTSKRTTANYRTVTDMAAYLALGVQTEPSEDCLSLHSDGLMYLHTCGDSDRYLCEYDGIAAVPSAY
jgi:lectin-like protein